MSTKRITGNKSALFEEKDWRQTDNKPLTEPMMAYMRSGLSGLNLSITYFLIHMYQTHRFDRQTFTARFCFQIWFHGFNDQFEDQCRFCTRYVIAIQ